MRKKLKKKCTNEKNFFLFNEIGENYFNEN